MHAAKRQGPKISPEAFESFKPLSANKEAHWLIASSAAPAHNISIINMYIPLSRSTFNTEACFSSPGTLMGTSIKKKALINGTAAQIKGSQRQDNPEESKAVVIKTTAICPPAVKGMKQAHGGRFFHREDCPLWD